MECKEMIKIVENAIKEKELKIKEKKQNINSNYTLAKLDFTVIDNMEDCLKTFNEVLKELNKLQNRIIERNRSN